MQSRITRYRLQKPEEIYPLSEKISSFFPTKPNVINGIHELLFNALEHGNLGIDHTLKAELLRAGNFADEMTRRAALPENKYKYVEIELIKERLFYRLTIRDQGRGFDWQKQLYTKPEGKAPHGSGLLIAIHCGFDRLVYNQHGNAVICTLRRQPLFKDVALAETTKRTCG